MGIFDFFRRNKKKAVEDVEPDDDYDSDDDDSSGLTLAEMMTGIRTNEIEEFFASDGDPNAVDSEGNTMLMRICRIAANLGEEMTCQLIIKCVDKGTDINIKNNNGDTALIFAICSQSFNYYDVGRVVRSLIANGADVNVMKSQGDFKYNESIMQAKTIQNADVYNLLIEAGAVE